MPLKKEKTQTPRVRKSPATPKPRTWTPEQIGEIAERAYYNFLSRGGQNGSELEDWLKAESEFSTTLNGSASRRRTRTA
jgi:hypothetical protein